MLKEKFLYRIGQQISFNHYISYSTFVITSSEIKTFNNRKGGIVCCHIYGIELDKSLYGKNLNGQFKNKTPSSNDMLLNFFITPGNKKNKFVAQTAEWGIKLMFENLKNNHQI